jgi:hypothetical protein
MMEAGGRSFWRLWLAHAPYGREIRLPRREKNDMRKKGWIKE